MGVVLGRNGGGVMRQRKTRHGPHWEVQARVAIGVGRFASVEVVMAFVVHAVRRVGRGAIAAAAVHRGLKVAGTRRGYCGGECCMGSSFT